MENPAMDLASDETNGIEMLHLLCKYQVSKEFQV
jgi:hypothetical protein